MWVEMQHTEANDRSGALSASSMRKERMCSSVSDSGYAYFGTEVAGTTHFEVCQMKALVQIIEPIRKQ